MEILLPKGLPNNSKSNNPLGSPMSRFEEKLEVSANLRVEKFNMGKGSSNDCINRMLAFLDEDVSHDPGSSPVTAPARILLQQVAV